VRIFEIERFNSNFRGRFDRKVRELLTFVRENLDVVEPRWRDEGGKEIFEVRV